MFAAGLLHGTPTWQTGCVGPCMTSPWRKTRAAANFTFTVCPETERAALRRPSLYSRVTSRDSALARLGDRGQEVARDRAAEARGHVIARDCGEALDRPRRRDAVGLEVRDAVVAAVGNVVEVRRAVRHLAQLVQRLVDRANAATGDLVGDRGERCPLRRAGARPAEEARAARVDDDHAAEHGRVVRHARNPAPVRVPYARRLPLRAC